MPKDMRTFIEQLEAAGELVHVREEVDVDVGMGNRLFRSRDKALLFENVKGFPNWKVLGQAPANMRHIALACGTETGAVINTFAGSLDKGLIPCRMVDSGPVQQKTLTGPEANLLDIPIHVAGARDPGRFIASGLCIIKDPETGTRNMAFHRLQVKGPQQTGIYMVEGRHTWLIHQKYESMNKPMPVAIMVGHHPMFYFAAGYSGHIDLDELEVAGALLGEPVELVKCKTIDMEAPAFAEMVIECVVPPHIREPEGPFSEFTGYYGGGQVRPVASVKAITKRHDAIYKAVQSSAHTESVFYNGMPQALSVIRDLRAVGNFNILDVTCNWGGTFNVVIKMTPRFYGEAKLALMAATSSHYLHQKVAIAVDDDVDIHDPQDVAWSLATRVNPAEDVIVISGTRGHPMDLTFQEVKKGQFKVPQRIGSKVLIDATKPPTTDPEERALFERVQPPLPR
ncbi:MAG: UbiD family decarboxylase [Thermodesulfobacteriota bacterium]